MNLTDFLIIYLACGAPFGVYYFLRNRTPAASIGFWIKTVLSFLFWVPFAFSLLRQSRMFKFSLTDFARRSSADSEREENIGIVQKNIEKILMASRLPISIYELRETIERYVGLTLAESGSDRKVAAHEREIYRIAPNKNIERAAICLNRRNRQRLSLHQTAARQDFLNLIEQISKGVADRRALTDLSLELIELINDSEALNEFEQRFAAAAPQTAVRRSVKNTEKDLWKPETHKPLSAERTPRWRVLNATANLRRRD